MDLWYSGLIGCGCAAPRRCARHGRSDAGCQRASHVRRPVRGLRHGLGRPLLIFGRWLFELADKTPDYPIAEESSERLIGLPFYDGLGQDDQDKLIRAIQEFDV